MLNYIRIKSKDQLEQAMAELASRLASFWNFSQQELIITYEPYKEPRSLSQNSLQWMWYEEMANYYSTRDNHFTKEDMHDLMVYKFLGTKDREIGHTKIQAQLRKTSDLKKHEMSDYLYQVEAWNTDNGLRLTIPAGNEYTAYRKART